MNYLTCLARSWTCRADLNWKIRFRKLKINFYFKFPLNTFYSQRNDFLKYVIQISGSDFGKTFQTLRVAGHDGRRCRCKLKRFSKKFDLKISAVIDAHGLKIRGGGGERELKVLPKSLGAKAFRKNCRGVLFHPPSPPVCIYYLV